ncbi:hypothetical protein DL240_15505 [Lujinxingia litoralis]|uniref:Uncharacterized protein n=2 Tax=Lujinxingia litoralis TaxID=2211119 RepID=A0A328C250_9DELT|nr:hypothetical protein DL240_15505 [Lujinxingia litoralis]
MLLAASAPAQAQPPTKSPPPSTGRLVSPSHQRFGLRVGLLGQLLFDAEPDELFRYADLGLRYKANDTYIDARIPGLTVGPDLLLMLTREGVTGAYQEPFLETLNAENEDVLQAWELAHLRVGYRFELHPPTRDPLAPARIDAAVGLYGAAELLLFEARQDVDQDLLRDLGYDDSLLIVAGAFLSAGRSYERTQFDVTLALGSAVRGEEENPDRRVLTAALDLDLLIDIGYGAGVYLRPRLHAYLTDLDPALTLSGAFTTGINITF